MTDYNDGKWHGWNGGKCPVHLKSKVMVALDNGKAAPRDTANEYGWDHGSAREGKIVAFRVVKAYEEPKEYTIDPRKNIMWYSHEDGLVHVKELV